MRLRGQSTIGWLMLQWLGVMVLGHHEMERRAARARETAEHVEAVRRQFKSEPPGLTDGVERLYDEGDVSTIDLATLRTWPSVEAMLIEQGSPVIGHLVEHGHAVDRTQPPGPPDAPELFLVPRFSFDGTGANCLTAVTREFAEAMGLDPDSLERAPGRDAQ